MVMLVRLQPAVRGPANMHMPLVVVPTLPVSFRYVSFQPPPLISERGPLWSVSCGNAMEMDGTVDKWEYGLVRCE